MATYQVTLAKSAARELTALEAALVRRISARIEALGADPRPRGCQKLVRGEGVWRIRVGEYRVLYTVNDADHVVDVAAIRHRRDAYR